ncbi:hypothetical protein D9M68_262670 [compost metagenome]
MDCSMAAVQPVRSLPAVQWNSAASSALASSMRTSRILERMPGSVTKARSLSSIMVREACALVRLMSKAPVSEVPITLMFM